MSEREESRKIRVVYIKPGEKPEIREMEDTLEACQEAVGGWIEMFQPFDDGTAIIPDELLQDYHTLTAYAYVTDDAGGYTKVQQDFAVYKRAKPADYVYTPTEHAGFDRLRSEIGELSALQTNAKENLVAAINEAAQSGGGGRISVEDDGAGNVEITEVPSWWTVTDDGNGNVVIGG